MTAVMTNARSWREVERHLLMTKQYWPIYLGRILEPFLYLFSVGIGVGELVDVVAGPGGTEISYRQFVAPAMVMGSAMNISSFGAAIDFWAKYKWIQTYDAMLATPLTVDDIMKGEAAWLMFQVGIQSVAFVLTMLAMGLVQSWWAVLVIPTALLVAAAFASAGFVAASLIRSWMDFDFVILFTIPMFFFSASFFPLDQYPGAIAWMVQATPLYHGVDLSRDLTLGTVSWTSPLSALYLVAVVMVCLPLARKRLTKMLQP